MKYGYIAIEGCIGAGKTTLAQMLSQYYQSGLILEAFEENPFLPDFYNNPERFGLSVELFFMVERFQKLKGIAEKNTLFNSLTIADYLFQKSFIFAGNNLKEDELKLYRTLFDIIYANLPKPELVLYLHASTETLLRNIKKRGRPYEQQIQAEYLESIQQSYLDYFKTQELPRVLVLSSDKLNFKDNYFDFESIISILEKDYPPGVHIVSA
jgi:deoxyguanosine kinase